MTWDIVKSATLYLLLFVSLYLFFMLIHKDFLNLHMSKQLLNTTELKEQKNNKDKKILTFPIAYQKHTSNLLELLTIT